MRRTTRSSRGRGRGRPPIDRGQTSRDPGDVAGPSQIAVEEERLVRLIRQVMSETQSRPTPESTTPVVPPRAEGDPATAVTVEVTPQPPPVQRRIEPIYTLSSHHAPSEFRGTLDPLVAEEWICSVERATSLFIMSDAEKIQYATYMMKGDARIWWEVIRQTLEVDSMTWVDFRREFERQYRSADVVAAKVQEFISLQQGSRTVREYSTLFDSLASFAPGLVSTPELRRDRFLQGLRPELAIQAIAGDRMPRTHGEVLEKAIRAEVYVSKFMRDSVAPSVVQTTIQPPSAQTASSVGSVPHEVSGRRDFQRREERTDRKDKKAKTLPACRRCGRSHPGECLANIGRNVCYRCRQPGHLMKDCRTPMPAPAPVPAPVMTPPAAVPVAPTIGQTSGGGTARVYTLGRSQDEAGPSSTAGTFLSLSISIMY